MPCTCTILTDTFDSPFAWNDHLIRVNDMLKVREIPLIVEENDRRNKDVCYSEVRERKSIDILKFMCLGNGVLNVDLAREKHSDLLNQSFGQDAIFVTEKHITFVAKDLWFEIDKEVIFAENSMKLSEGMNILPQNAMT